MMTAGAINLREVAPPEILDPRHVGAAFRPMFPERSKGARGPRQWRSLSRLSVPAYGVTAQACEHSLCLRSVDGSEE